jgi:hypothetical protein
VYGALAGYALFSAFPLINMVEIPIAMAQNFANVVQAGLGGVVQLALGVLSVPAAVVGATASQLQAVFDAVKTGDLLGTINEALGIPGAFVGALLNGFGFNPGLLSPDGFVDIAIRTLNSIAEALGAAPVAAPMLAPFAAKAADTGPSALPSDPSTVATVTLDTDAGVTDGATQAPATQTSPDDTIVTEPVATEPVAEPLAAEPVAIEPVSTEPVVQEPAATEPAVTEPAADEPVANEPISTEPALTEPAAIDAEAAAERESSKRELRTAVGASGGETGKAGVSPSAVGKKSESTTSAGSISPENRSDSTDSGKDSTSSHNASGPSGNDSSGAAA